MTDILQTAFFLKYLFVEISFSDIAYDFTGV